MKIPKNASLIAQKFTKDPHISIVLCRIDHGTKYCPVEYVTWVYNHDFNGCVSGHYFQDISEAIKDYEIRL